MPEVEDYYSNVPALLKSIPHWVTWKSIQENGEKPKKIPFMVTGKAADSTKPDTWDVFESVKSLRPVHTRGIGFVFTQELGLLGLDLDNALLENGDINPKFKDIVDKLSSYTEISPSGKGLHLFIKCKELPYEKGRHINDIGIFYTERYFTITGIKWKNSPSEINEYGVELIRELCKPFIKEEIKHISSPTTITDFSDQEILSKFQNAGNSAKFNNLMSGSIVGYPSASEADAALAGLLAFYSTDEHQIERIMRSSGLVRDKWDKNVTYLSRTISKAISLSPRYEPPFQTGDVKEGREIANTLLNQKQKEIIPPIDLVDDEFLNKCKKIRDANKLPEFPVDTLDGTLFGRYIKYGMDTSYSKPEFHVATALSLLSLVVGRRAVVMVGSNQIYLNIFALVLGYTSISGKSWATDMGIGAFSSVVLRKEEFNIAESVKMITSTTSNAALIQNLCDVWNLFWYYDECATFFEEAASWNSSVLSTMCGIYDGRKQERNLSSRGKETKIETISCDEPFMSILFSMTTTQFNEYATVKMNQSGFLPRLMIFLGEGGNPRKNQNLTKEQINELKLIIEKVKEIRDELYNVEKYGIQFKVSDEIEEWKLNNNISHQSSEDELYRAACSRGFAHAYKIAGILSIFDDDFRKEILRKYKPGFPVTIEIPKKYSRAAIRIMDEYLLPRSLFAARISESCDLKNHQVQILKALHSLGGACRRTELIHKTHLNKRQMDDALEALEEAGQIKREMRSEKEKTKPTEFVFLIKL